MNLHPPTPEQQAILDAVNASPANLMITAFAGTGKTSTLVMIANKVPMQPALALAFNVSIKKELEKRFAGEIRWYLTQLFERSAGHVVLSSIHRAKGLEWDVVLHLDPWRIPSKFAQQNPAQMKQELNLRYVAETRTKRLLIEANLEDFE